MGHDNRILSGVAFDLETVLRFLQTVIAVWLGSLMAHKTNGSGSGF